MRRFPVGQLLALLVGLVPPIAAAQTPSGEKPDLVLEAPEAALGLEQKIDLENIVLGAAKAVTTVQEAPGIVTIISRDEITRRGFRTLTDAIRMVPGWQPQPFAYHAADFLMTRGVFQSALKLVDGLSLYDPLLGGQNYGWAVPIEMVKRLEVVTGPGGVLWGANSFLGITSILTRDASDINGFEVGAGYGDGFCSAKSLTPCGDSTNAKVYGIFGKAWGKLSVIQHVNFQTYHGVQTTDLQMNLHSTSPYPLGPTLYGPAGLSDSQRSFIVNIDGKITYGPFSAGYSAPWMQLMKPAHWGGGYAQQGTSARYTPAQTAADMQLGGYCNDPANPAHAAEWRCKDPQGFARSGEWSWYERYAYGRYRDSFVKDTLTVDAKGYYTQYVRRLYPNILPPWLPLMQGGIQFNTDPLIQRYGGTVDVEYKALKSLKILGGVEAFQESVRDGGVKFPSLQPSALPLPCPWTSTAAAGNWGKPYPYTSDGWAAQCPLMFVYDSDRVTVGGYVDLQWKPVDKLLVEAGYRPQAGVAGKRQYGLQNLASGAVVYQFLPNFHAKVNYASGFRPPTFQSTDANSKGINYASSPGLAPETSQSVQGEINARLLRNVRSVRGLTLRADYSYTWLHNLIRVLNGTYQNSGDRGIHAGEFLAKLHLAGDHQFYLGYSYLKAYDTVDGNMRNFPNHWFTAGASINIIRNRLALTTNLFIAGAHEDQNRTVRPNADVLYGSWVARYSDMVFDRLPPQADWQVGLRAYGFFKDRLWFDLNVYNVLNQRSYAPDTFYDWTARLEQRPNPNDSLAFWLTATFAY
jgi:outer membrane receptor protein involved in Fe transport